MLISLHRDYPATSRRRSQRLSLLETNRRRSLLSTYAASVKTYGDDDADVLIDSTLKVSRPVTDTTDDARAMSVAHSSPAGMKN